jgi:ElaB/YqjD/DUF883 family membrane-anchored ribosome-binding protein
MNTEFTPDIEAQTTPNVVDKAAAAADQAIRKTRVASNVALDRLSEGVEKARDTTSPMYDDSVEAVKARSAHLREQADQLSAATSERIRSEPLKAVAIAAAVGMLVGLFINRPRYRDY